VNHASCIQSENWTEPAECFPRFARRPGCVWLDTAAPPLAADGQSVDRDALGEHCRYSIIAAEPARILRAKADRVEIIAAGGVTRMRANPFDALQQQLAGWQAQTGDQHGFPAGAAIGYFAYDLKNQVETLPANAEDDLGLPDCWFGFYPDLMVFDHVQRRVMRVSLPWPGGRVAPAPVAGGRETDAVAWPVEPRSNLTREQYGRMLSRAQDYIAAGDIYQVNLAQRFQCAVDTPAAELYLALRTQNPAPYCAYLDIGEAQILSSSPECFLKIRDRHVVTRPIKGTRRRQVARDADRRVAAELLASPKDNAELLMITDLERNDLGKVCQFGSVWVSDLVRVEGYATVWHLVSTVEGLLRRELTHVDCVRACFPGGSITGAPKIRAMQIIDELEPHARGVYTGAIGFFGFNGLTELSVAIRSAVYQRGRLTFHAGGGIVADSDPAAEHEETLAKAQGIFNAIEQLRLRQRPLPA
jgi:para-aminobenzoate synthetase component 1